MIKSATPYYVTPDKRIELYLGDSLALMASIEPMSAGAVLSDPPYGLDYESQEWDATIPLEWLDMALALAPVVAFTTAHTTMWDYPRPRWVGCWYRECSSCRTSFGRFSHWCPVLIYEAEPGKRVRGLITDTIRSVDFLPTYKENAKGLIRLPHVCAKPVELFNKLARAFMVPDETLIDPFCGSGTSGITAVNLGLRYTGIDKDPASIEVAKSRISKAWESRQNQRHLNYYGSPVQLGFSHSSPGSGATTSSVGNVPIA